MREGQEFFVSGDAAMGFRQLPMRVNLRARDRVAQVRWWLEEISPAGT